MTGGEEAGAGANASSPDALSAYLTDYPKLQHISNARRNIKKCFQELDYFHEIPILCDKLKDDLQIVNDDNDKVLASDYEYDPITLSAASNDHVDMLICLAEIESALKNRMDDDAMQKYNSSSNKNLGSPARRGNMKVKSPVIDNEFMIQQRFKNNRKQLKQFLHHRKSLVWKLGDSIRARIVAFICRAFDEALNDDTRALKALIESVELYEIANEQSKLWKASNDNQSSTQSQVSSSSSSNARISILRPAVLQQLYRHFEQRGRNVFNNVYSRTRKDLEDERRAKLQRQAEEGSDA